MQRYVGRVVMVSGAGQGLGRAMALRFAEEGAQLALCDLNSVAVKETEQACGPERALSSTVDVSDGAEVDQWLYQTVANFGRVDVLVNNAGVIRDSRLETMSDNDWDTVLDVSLRGSFHCSRSAFRQMKAQEYGRILSMSSMCWRGNFGQANYVAAKAGIVGMARTIALEGARHGITSNVIAPGLIDTPMLASMDADAREKLASRIPAQQVGDPADIAEAAAFLCSEAARYVTGVVLDVDGGISIGSSLR
ncbi:SDR family oxidoreductase [Amycolatopsis acidicola]|uniref:SDR family oxidoreductase n=1 Tax=Amycolatopsis acidicola TaxID=2596893 RepID=A0A5N0UQN5_9PSEU|nr:SDR family NAD(P)-dependent oxidoreductase [Amycolatopsis acidicola]KAA9151105.1 SDR family oxidoreductase [Amycolatopsis acidicola]